MNRMLEQTLQYTKEYKAFGKIIGSFQNSRFVLAGLATEAIVMRTMVDEFIFIHLHLEKELTAEQVTMVKLCASERSSHN